jgi:hypothetical protein
MDELKERDPAKLEEEPLGTEQEEGSDWKVVPPYGQIPAEIT